MSHTMSLFCSVAIKCSECYTIHVQEGISAITKAVENMLRTDVFRGPLPPGCDNPMVTQCHRGSVCVVDHSTYTTSGKYRILCRGPVSKN